MFTDTHRISNKPHLEYFASALGGADKLWITSHISWACFSLKSSVSSPISFVRSVNIFHNDFASGATCVQLSTKGGLGVKKLDGSRLVLHRSQQRVYSFAAMINARRTNHRHLTVDATLREQTSSKAGERPANHPAAPCRVPSGCNSICLPLDRSIGALEVLSRASPFLLQSIRSCAPEAALSQKDFPYIVVRFPDLGRELHSPGENETQSFRVNMNLYQT